MNRWTVLLATVGLTAVSVAVWRMHGASSAGTLLNHPAGAAPANGLASAAAIEQFTSTSTPGRPARTLAGPQVSDPVESDPEKASGFARRGALYAIAARADAAGLNELIDEARTVPDQNERLPALEILLLRLAEQDLDAAVRNALGGERTDAHHLIATLATIAPEQVWRSTAQVGDPLARMEVQSAVAAVWIAQDPERAFASVAALPADWTREQLMRQATWALARQDPRLAIDLVKTVPESERSPLFLAVADQWSRQDPGAAAQWVETLDVTLQGQLAYRVAGAYLAQQPEEALNWALRISRSPGRNLWSSMIGQMAAYDPDEALRRAQAAENPRQRAQAMGRAVAAIAARNPVLATAYLEKIPPGEARNRAASEIAAQIAQTRPGSAIEWLRELDPALRFAASEALAGQLAYRDVDAAAELTDRVPRDARYAWIQQVAGAYAQLDAARGAQWVDKWSEDAPHIVHNFIQSVAMRSPDEALTMIDRLTDGEERDRMLTAILSTLAMQSPESAARHVNEIANDSARAQAAGGIAAVWARYDPAAARKWTLSLTSSQIRDTALSQMISNVASLEDRLSIIEEVQSPELRMNAVFNAAVNMAHTDPEGMRTLLRRHPLDPQRQQQLDAMLTGQRRRW